MNFLEPSPVLLAYLFVQKFVWLELIALLALLRVALARGPSRLAAALALLLSLAGIAIIFAPAFGAMAHPAYASAARLMTLGQGLWALLAPSVFLASSAFLPGMRARWIDFVHIALLWGLVGLWIATRMV
ncbi:hypothetical protein [Salipiger sp.]|uniref:hypothetical protein n=1 Tax=Salipiger sp. TaxID=2078585 RepID=UPI003A975434